MVYHSQPPFLVGLTGCMGSGKSSVARVLCQDQEIECIDADRVCRGLLEPGEKGWRIIKKKLGENFFDSRGRIDRVFLRKKIFSEEAFRLKLNSLIHPLAWEEIQGTVARSSGKKQEARILIEVPLLYEAGWDSFFRKVIMVYADPETCMIRLMARDQLTREEAHDALATQWPAARKAMLADHVIDNSRTWGETCLQLKHLHQILWTDETGRN